MHIKVGRLMANGISFHRISTLEVASNWLAHEHEQKQKWENSGVHVKDLYFGAPSAWDSWRTSGCDLGIID